METNKIINQLNYLFELLDFETISSLNDEDFRILILKFFLKVKELKDEGLNLNDDLRDFIDKKHIEYYDLYEKNPVYEERMQMVLSELNGFCSPPIFWSTTFEEYMERKWSVEI